MAVRIYNSDGVDLDDLLQITNNVNYTVSRYLMYEDNLEFGGDRRVRYNNSFVAGSDSQYLTDRYASIKYGNKHPNPKIRMDVQWIENNTTSSPKGNIGGTNEYYNILDYACVKGSFSTPVYSPSSTSSSFTAYVNTSTPEDYKNFTFTPNGGNPSATSMRVNSATITAVSGDFNYSEMSRVSGYPTVTNFTVYDRWTFFFDTQSGETTYKVTYKVQARNEIGWGNERTHSYYYTVNWDTRGCFEENAIVMLHDGSEKKLKDLRPGDRLASLDIDGVIDESDPNWETWKSDNLNYEQTSANIKMVVKCTWPEYYLINEELKVTYEHPLLIFREGVWSWVQVENLNVGDEFSCGKKVDSLRLVQDKIDVVSLDVEPTDNYLIKLNDEWICAHNAPSKGGGGGGDPF